MTGSFDRMRLLVVEDNLGDFVLIEDYLRDQMLHVEVVHAVDFATARRHLVESGHFDAVLLDLSLPDRTGEELVHQTMSLVGATPVIVLTGYSDKEFGIKTLSFGVSDYLLKDELTPPHLVKSVAYSIERAKIVRRLKESEHNYRNLFNLSPLPIWVFDLRTWQVLTVNDAALHMFGYSRDEMLGMDIRELRPPEDVPLLEASLGQSAENGRDNQGVFRHKSKDGRIMQSEVYSNSITIDGKMARLVLAFDVTERLRHLKAIEDQNSQLRDIAWFQSHVVRAPLARIMGIVDLMGNIGDAEREDNSKMMEHLINSATELDGIIHDIVSRTERINRL